MNKLEFIEKVKLLNIKISDVQAENFFIYMKLLLEWNKKMNLTAITNEDEVILKRLRDRVTRNKYMNGKKLIGIGTGAGFPSIPLKIVNKDIPFILVDSLNKRINFLDEVRRKLQLENLVLIHSRAEDLALKEEYRENIDIVVARAVASLRILVEYMLPFVKMGGLCICMKGPNIEDEIESAQNAIDILGGKIEKIEKIILPESNIERSIILIRKIKKTNSKYPRKAGIPSKNPL